MTVRRLLRITLVTIASILIVLYAAVVAYFMSIEHSMVYPPSTRTLPIVPTLQPYAETVTFAPDGQSSLSGLIVRAATPTPRWVYFLHGNEGNVTTCQRWQLLAHQIGVNMFVLDYQGFGKSAGTPSETGIYRDALAGYTYLTRDRQVSAPSLVIYGHSLGATVALDVASRVPAAGVVVEGAFLSLPERGQEMFPFLPVSLIMRNRFSAIDRVAQVSGPKLFMHASTDNTVPFRHGRTLFERAAPPKRFVELRGNHANAVEIDQRTASEALAAFMNEVAPESRVALQR